MTKENWYTELTQDIQNAYEGAVTISEAEKLAAKFLLAQMRISSEIAAADLDARMRKSGLKAIKAAVYLDEVTKSDKKPTEATLSAKIDSNELVASEQNAFDTLEVEAEKLSNYMSVFREAHIYFRNIGRGSFNG